LQNTEYEAAFTAAIKKIYCDSWVYQYFSLDVGSLENDKGIVCFLYTDKNKKASMHWDSSRIQTFCHIPENFKTHLFPASDWVNLEDSIDSVSEMYPMHVISGITHGMLTNGYPYSKSPFYTAPYLLIFRSRQHGIEANYLSFNDFLLSPSYNHILALLNYDENSEKFVPSYHADVLLPYNDVLSLNNVLEFYITDANRKPVLVKDMSQLFISIQFL
jgi:hypothetical protein